MKSTDEISIQGLKVNCHIGATDDERVEPQELLVDATFSPFRSRVNLNDDLSRTIDYHAVAVRLVEVASARPRKLIETLAEDIAEVLISEFAIRLVRIKVEKFILPNARSVSVSITRQSKQQYGRDLDQIKDPF